MFDIWKCFYYVEVLIIAIVQKFEDRVGLMVRVWISGENEFQKHVALFIEQKLCSNASAVTSGTASVF